MPTDWDCKIHFYVGQLLASNTHLHLLLLLKSAKERMDIIHWMISISPMNRITFVKFYLLYQQLFLKEPYSTEQISTGLHYYQLHTRGKTILGICCPNLSRCCPPVLSQDAVRTQDGWDGLVFFLTVSNGPYLSNAKFTYRYKYRSRCDEDFNSKDSGWENWSHKS